MSPSSIALLILQGMLFLAWIFVAFRWLFALRADATSESGSVFPGPGSTLRAFRGALVDARYANERVLLGILTLALAGSSLLQFLIPNGGIHEAMHAAFTREVR